MEWYIWIGFGSGEGLTFSVNGYFGDNSFLWTIKKPFKIERWKVLDDEEITKWIAQ